MSPSPPPRPTAGAAAPSAESPGLLGRALRGLAAAAGSAHLGWALPLVVGLLDLPALDMGFFADDFVLLGLVDAGRPDLLYTFADPESLSGRLLGGELPWFADPGVAFRFARPLAAALLGAERALFGDVAWLYHLVGVLWHVALVAVATALLRRALPGRAGAFAAVLYALDDTRDLPVAWIANHYVLLCATFGWAAIGAHLRAARSVGVPRLLARVGSAGLLALSLAAGEAGLCAFAFLVAWELAAALAGADPDASAGGRGPREAAGPRWAGLLRLVPAGLVFAAWAAWYTAHGFGAQRSAVYVDPLRDPLLWLSAAPGRVLVLVGAQLGGVFADLGLFYPPAVPLQVALGLGCVAVVALVGRAVWATVPPEHRRALAWLVPGALLALLPVLSTFPTDRLLVFPGLGGAALVGVGLDQAARRLGGEVPGGLGRAARLLTGVALWLGVAQPVVGLAGLFAWSHTAMGTYVRWFDSAPVRAAAGRLVIVPASGDPHLSYYFTARRELLRQPPALVSYVLSMARADHRLTRTAADRFELAALGGELGTTMYEQLVRRPSEAFEVGEEVARTHLRVRVLALGPGGGVTRVEVHLDRALDDPSVLWLGVREGEVVELVPPPVGGTLELPWTPGPLGL